jgi:hypothetical protein
MKQFSGMLQREHQVSQLLHFMVKHAIGDRQVISRVRKSDRCLATLLGDSLPQHRVSLGHKCVSASNSTRCDIS